MTHFINFKSATDASGYILNDIPFVGTVPFIGNEKITQQNLHCNETGKYIRVENTSAWIEDRYPGLKFKSHGQTTISMTNANGNSPDIKYSLNYGETWTQWNYNSVALNDGDVICFKGSNPNVFSISSTQYSYFVFNGSGTIEASGNIMSLIDNGECDTLTIPSVCCFHKLFYNCSKLISAPELPATTLAGGCYNSMFYGCTSLASAPTLPATTLAQNCYNSMFYGCTSLSSAPTLPSTTLTNNCYYQMFYGCTSLSSAPELPATTLTQNCYYQMFRGCTSLTNAPKLSATALASGCYQNMFFGCTSLTNAPKLSATALASGCYQNMFFGCTSLISAPKLQATVLANYCYCQMFQNCTSLSNIQKILPATNLANQCYGGMFANCTSLITAPELPATTLVTKCYSYERTVGMFSGCTNLSYIKCGATSGINDTNTYEWVKNVSTDGTFVQKQSATWPTGNSGTPTNWQVQYY